MAFITSRYTMDSKDSTVRRYIAERAELLGAIRLPNNAFKANAGAEVVSDILFFQKRDRPIVNEPEWVSLGENKDGLPSIGISSTIRTWFWVEKLPRAPDSAWTTL